MTPANKISLSGILKKVNLMFFFACGWRTLLLLMFSGAHFVINMEEISSRTSKNKGMTAVNDANEVWTNPGLDDNDFGSCVSSMFDGIER